MSSHRITSFLWQAQLLSCSADDIDPRFLIPAKQLSFKEGHTLADAPVRGGPTATTMGEGHFGSVKVMYYNGGEVAVKELLVEPDKICKRLAAAITQCHLRHPRPRHPSSPLITIIIAVPSPSP